MTPDTARCQTFRQELDFYLDHELSPDRTAEVALHLESCEDCSTELRAKSSMRDRLREASRNMDVSPTLPRRVHGSLRSVRSRSWSSPMLAVAATVVVCVGAVSMFLYHDRMSRSEYIASVTQRVSAIMRAGLGDHIHCAVFRKFPKNPPTISQLVSDMGPRYKDVVAVVNDRVPSGYHVMMAHDCQFNGRAFIHLSATDGSHLVSLVISRREAGESFEASRLAPALIQSGIPIYRDGAGGFDIAGFETRDHLVYVVSDAGSRTNSEMMAAFAPGIRDALDRIGS